MSDLQQLVATAAGHPSGRGRRHQPVRDRSHISWSAYAAVDIRRPCRRRALRSTGADLVSFLRVYLGGDHDGHRFRSWLGLIAERHAGVVVLVNDARSPDSRAFDLLRTVASGGDLRPGRA